MSYGETKASIRRSPKAHVREMSVLAANYLSMRMYDKRSTTISWRESKTAS